MSYFQYHNDVKDQIDLDAKVSLVDEKVKFDDVGEDSTNDDLDAENSDESDEDEDNYEEFHRWFYALIILIARELLCDIFKYAFFSGYGEEYDDEYDVDTSFEDESVDPEKGDDENNIYKDMTKHTRYLYANPIIRCLLC